jgi:O-acetyl-ADP-ribose deacetylase (regulator of RNase III)
MSDPRRNKGSRYSRVTRPGKLKRALAGVLRLGHDGAHGCICQGVMGAGIALGFRQRYPDMFDVYRERCRARPRAFNLGDVILWEPAPSVGTPAVFNLATQEGVGRGKQASYQALSAALHEMRALADRAGITSVALPLIGAGLGGLHWERVLAITRLVLGPWAGTAWVYEAR